MTRPTRAVVDLSAVAHNFRLLRDRAGGATEVLPVVKADGYGHGAVPVARRLAAEGARRFAVALLEEGLALRQGGISEDILLLSSGDPADAALLVRERLLPALWDVEQARGLAQAAGVAGAGPSRPLRVHLKLDTGMGRLGIRPADLPAMIGVLRQSTALSLAGTFTQFASAEDPDSEATGRQVREFEAALSALRAGGVDPGLVHASNSAAVLAFPAARFDAVRPGIALYGVSPSEHLRDTALSPALTLETRVLSVKRVPAGTALGYGGTFVTARTTTVATLPIGYHDGFRRSLSGRSSVLLPGGKAPIVGAVSMDLTLADATDCGAEPGDRGVLLGREGDEEIGAWDLARAAGTIPYEILCGIGARVPRTYLP